MYVHNLLCAIEFVDAHKAAEVESVWLDMKMGSGSTNLLRIGAFYRPGNRLRDQQAELDQNICEEIHRNFRTQCLNMGDFNLRAYEVSGNSNRYQ